MSRVCGVSYRVILVVLAVVVDIIINLAPRRGCELFVWSCHNRLTSIAVCFVSL